MHIVYLAERIDITGGIERSMTTRVNYLIKKYNYKITIVCTEKNTGIPAYDIDDSVSIIFLDSLTTKWSVVGRIYLRFQQANMILNNLNPDLIISVKYTLHNLFFKLLPSKSKLISEMRETKENYNQNKNHSIKTKLNSYIRDYILKNQDVMIVLTEADKKSWNFSNIKVVPNPQTIESKEVSNLLMKQVLAIGRLNKVKGFDKLIEVWNIVNKAHPDWNLKICGEGEEYQYLSSRIKQLNLQNNIILTNKFVSVVPEFLNSSIFVLTSQFEAFGNVLVEAKTCGVPIVSFDAPNGPKEIIVQGKDGFIVELNNIEKMAEKIIYLIKNQRIRTQMGRFAKNDSMRFSVKTILELYNYILLQA